jgi:hypothetical protein
LYRKDFQRKELRDVTNKDFNEDTVILDESMSESYYKVPEFDTMMFLPAHLQELPPSPKEEVKDTLAEDEEIDELPIGDDLEEDEFYKGDNKEIDFDDIQDIFRQTLEKHNNGIKFTLIYIENSKVSEDDFHDTVIRGVLNRFNISNTIPSISGFLKKKSGTIKLWQKRYFICRGNELCYFKSPKDSVLRG